LRYYSIEEALACVPRRETGFQRGMGGGFRSSSAHHVWPLGYRYAGAVLCPQQRGPLRSQSCSPVRTASVVPFAQEALRFNLSHCAPTKRVNHETALNKDVCDRSASELAWSCVAEMTEKTKKCRFCDQAYSGGPVRIKAHILSSARTWWRCSQMSSAPLPRGVP